MLGVKAEQQQVGQAITFNVQEARRFDLHNYKVLRS